MPKPKLVFFQHKYDVRLPAFLSMHAREHSKCLSHFFDVRVIDEDCDYQKVCEQHEADLAIFESGVPFASCRRPIITNTRACPQVPKAGLLNADAFGEGRSGFLSDMEHWGVDTYFAIATTAPQHIPEIANRLFIWPNSVDVDLYRDYGQTKIIPVLFTGNQNALYPWRQRITRIVSRQYPSLISPHPGYAPIKEATQFMVGEPYARMLNASYFVPACGTITREVVRKHFEVPACRSCLVTQKSAGLEAGGFVDMVNCVFADERDVLEKLAFLFANPGQLRSITDAGYQLVRSRHTSMQRDQILQWFTLQKNLAPNTKIVQPDPFAPLEVVGAGKPINPRPSEPDSLLGLIRQGDEKLSKGDCRAAENLYLKCLNYYRFMPEPQVKLALCNLRMGNAKAALNWIKKPIQFTLAEYKAADPDPVEWAYFIVTLLCLGRIREAAERSEQFPWLHHSELDRARIAVACLRSSAGSYTTESIAVPASRRSLHQLPDQPFKDWMVQLSEMLRACGKGDLAQKIIQYAPSKTVTHPESVDSSSRLTAHTDTSAHSIERRAAAQFKRQLRYQHALAALKFFVKKSFSRVEVRYGKFLPAFLTRYRKDPVNRAILDRCADQDVRSILILGVGRNEISSRAVLAASQAARGRMSIFGVSVSKRLTKVGTQACSMHLYQLRPTSAEPLNKRIEEIILSIRYTHQIGFFDVLIINASQLRREAVDVNFLYPHLDNAKWVLLEDINNRLTHAAYIRLSEDPRFFLLDRDLNGKGYAIFERSIESDFRKLSSLLPDIGMEPSPSAQSSPVI